MIKEIIVKVLRKGMDFVLSAFFSLDIYDFRIEDPAIYYQIKHSGLQCDYLDENLICNENEDDLITLITYLERDKVDVLLEKLKTELSYIDKDLLKFFDIQVKEHVSVDWLNLWKQHYEPLIIEKYIIIPSWEKGKSKEVSHLIPIYIKPSYAFGTGEHESTQICLKIMSHIDFDQKTVVDVGTGSGILGIASIKKGAFKCYFLDIDKDSIKSAMENYYFYNCPEQGLDSNEKELYLENLLKTSIKHCQGSQDSREKAIFLISNLLNDVKESCFDIVIANITMDAALLLLTDLDSKITQDGLVVLSGILKKDKDIIINKYEDRGYSLMKEVILSEWTGLLLKRRRE